MKSDPCLFEISAILTETCDYVSFTSSYINATRFERVEILVEMGEWMTGKGLTRAGCDYFRSALDLIYDVEEKVRVVSYPSTLECREARCPMVHLCQKLFPTEFPHQVTVPLSKPDIYRCLVCATLYIVDTICSKRSESLIASTLIIPSATSVACGGRGCGRSPTFSRATSCLLSS